MSLVPQVIHSFRTNSTEDLSYSSQPIHLTGLSLDFAYMLLLHAKAGWVTSVIEIFLPMCLLALKIHLDGCGGSTSQSNSKEAQGKEMDEDESIVDTCSSNNDSEVYNDDDIYDIENQMTAQSRYDDVGNETANSTTE